MQIAFSNLFQPKSIQASTASNAQFGKRPTHDDYKRIAEEITGDSQEAEEVADDIVFSNGLAAIRGVVSRAEDKAARKRT